MRQAMYDSGPDSLLISEHCHDCTPDVQAGGWDGVMKYAGFIRPVWTWLRDEGSAPSFLGSPLVVPRLAGSSVM
jgi:alpha-glucosidase